MRKETHLRCNACGESKLEYEIDCISYNPKGLPEGVTSHYRFCKNNPECVTKAKIKKEIRSL